MQDNRCSPSSSQRENVCIDTYRVLDSCRDRDCFEDVRVYLCDFGQEIINHTSNVRVKRAELGGAYVGVECIQFNRGFYQVVVRIYVRITFEACLCQGRVQEFEGVAVVEKRVILYGSEGSVNIYRSGANCGFCSGDHDCSNYSSNMPVAVLETVDPVVLGVRVVEPHNPCQCYCCCSCEEIPTSVLGSGGGVLGEYEGQNRLYVSLGFFSVIRIERPAQYIVSAQEYCVPDKECVVALDDDPCSIFRSMSFPTSEFCPPSLSNLSQKGDSPCACKGK
jgi:hypothetical protein